MTLLRPGIWRHCDNVLDELDLTTECLMFASKGGVLKCFDGRALRPRFQVFIKLVATGASSACPANRQRPGINIQQPGAPSYCLSLSAVFFERVSDVGIDR